MFKRAYVFEGVLIGVAAGLLAVAVVVGFAGCFINSGPFHTYYATGGTAVAETDDGDASAGPSVQAPQSQPRSGPVATPVPVVIPK